MSCPTIPATDHDRLRLDLMSAGRRLRGTADDESTFPDAREDLAAFCFGELLPHLEQDERWLVEVGRCDEGRLLAEAVRAENRAITAAVYELAAATSACDAVAATRVLHTLLAAHTHHVELLSAATGERGRR